MITTTKRWRSDSVAFIREAMGVKVEPWQARVIAAYRRPGKTDTAIALLPRPSLWRRLLARLGLVAVVLAVVGCGRQPEASLGCDGVCRLPRTCVRETGSGTGIEVCAEDGETPERLCELPFGSRRPVDCTWLDGSPAPSDDVICVGL